MVLQVNRLEGHKVVEAKKLEQVDGEHENTEITLGEDEVLWVNVPGGASLRISTIVSWKGAKVEVYNGKPKVVTFRRI